VLRLTWPRVIAWVAVAVGLLVAAGFAWRLAFDYGPPARYTRLVAPRTTSVGLKTTVRIHGEWPSPGWQFRRASAVVEGGRILLGVEGKRRRVLTPSEGDTAFEVAFDLPQLPSSQYSLEMPQMAQPLNLIVYRPGTALATKTTMSGRGHARKLTGPRVAQVGEPVTFTVSGVWPDCSYEGRAPKPTLSVATVVLAVTGRYDTGFQEAAPELPVFEYEVPVAFDHTGTYLVRAEGTGKGLELFVDVQEEPPGQGPVLATVPVGRVHGPPSAPAGGSVTLTLEAGLPEGCKPAPPRIDRSQRRCLVTALGEWARNTQSAPQEVKETSFDISVPVGSSGDPPIVVGGAFGGPPIAFPVRIVGEAAPRPAEANADVARLGTPSPPLRPSSPGPAEPPSARQGWRTP